MDKFRDVLLKTLFEMEGLEPEEYILSKEDLDNIEKLYNEKYNTWQWNYGESPKFNYQNYKRFPFGSIDIRFNVINGLISESKIYGDFFGVDDVSLLQSKLNGIEYNRESIEKLLNEENLKQYFGAIEDIDFINLMFE